LPVKALFRSGITPMRPSIPISLDRIFYGRCLGGRAGVKVKRPTEFLFLLAVTVDGRLDPDFLAAGTALAECGRLVPSGRGRDKEQLSGPQ
jgi:hypothetical protein